MNTNTMTVTIDVTQEDINNHLEYYPNLDNYHKLNSTCFRCQIARALSRSIAFGLGCAIGYGFSEDQIDAKTLGVLPEKAARISMLDEENTKPFSFQLTNVPKELVKYCEE